VQPFPALRRSRGPLAALTCVFAFSLATPSFANDPKIEGEAKKLQQDAMDVDFLGLDLKKAKEKLQKAIKKCGKDKCSKPVLATLHRDLAIVELNAGNQADGEKEFVAALTNDPNVTVAKDYLDNAAVKKGWDAAKKKKGGGGGEEGSGEEGGGGDTSVPAPAEGGLSVKAALAPVGYELPLIVIVPSGVDVKTIKVSYKTDAMEKYKSIEAKKISGKWVVILPCDVTGKTGSIKYFAKAFDDSDSEVEHYGTIKKPAQVKLVDSMPDDQESPQLPGGKDPKECREGGGEGGGGTKEEGDSCAEDDECQKGLVCSENDTGKKVCRPGEKKPSSEAPKLWVGAGGQIDLMFLGKESNICLSSGWACSADVNGSRRDIAETANDGAVAVKDGGKTDGGMSVATKRVFLSLDYFVAPRISLGGRLGYTFGLNPTDISKSFPLHVEARVQYFITDGVFRPFFMANAGYGAFDAPVPNVIVHPASETDATDCLDPGVPVADCQTDRKVIKGVTAYKLGGPFFVGLGIGAWLHPTPKVAIGAAAKVIFPLPVFAVTFAPEASIAFAF